MKKTGPARTGIKTIRLWYTDIPLERRQRIEIDSPLAQLGRCVLNPHF